jgi:hypothetical protein
MVAVGALVAAFVVPRLVNTAPSTVGRVSLVNNGPDGVQVSVTDAKRDGWTELGVAKAHATTTIQDVVNQGPVWIFRIQAQGQPTEVTISRPDLARNGWQVVIPAAAGTAPSAGNGVPASSTTSVGG